MTLSNSQSSSGNSNNDVLVHRTSSNTRNSGSGGGSRRNNTDRGQVFKNCSSQYHNKSAGESERTTMPIASTGSYGSGDASTEHRSTAENNSRSKDSYLDDRLYKLSPEEMDPAIISRGSASNSRRYTRSALYLLRNDTRSRCRPKCASKLQLLCIWKTNNSNYSNCNQQNGGSNLSNSSNTMDMTSSLSSPRMSSITRQQSNHDLQSNGNASGSSHHGNQKNYLDHRSISSSHLMPAFAKRRIGNSMQSNSGSAAGNPSLTTSSDSMKVQGANGKSGDHKQFLSPQRKHLNVNQMSKSVQLNSCTSSDGDRDHHRERDRERGRDNERDVNFNNSGSSSSNARERRIGSGRLLPRDANWDYRPDKDSNSTSTPPGSMPFEKDLSSHSSTSGNNTQRLSSNSGGNQNSLNQRFDYAHRSPTSKERISGGKNSSEYRSESRYESRRSFARSDYERDNRGDNSNYVRRFMSDLINQNSGNNFGGKSSGGGLHDNRRRNHRNDEPEWFSSGPTSQHDTIELRGFDEVEDSNSNSSGSNGGNSKRNKRNTLRRNKANNSRTSSFHDLSLDENMSQKDIEEVRDDDNSDAVQDVNKTSSQPDSPNANSFTSRNKSPHLKSDTNNNSSRDNICTYNENSSCSENKTDGVVEGDVKNNSATTTVTNNQDEDKTGFNFDAFLNADPLSNLIMGEQSSVDNEAGSRFSRWFGKQGDNVKSSDSRKPSISEEMVSMLNVESQMIKNAGGIPIATESTNTNQSNTLMEFLQRGKINAASGNTEPIANVGSIPSVEELEARMRKIGDENPNIRREQSVSNINDNMNNPLNQFLANTVHHHQQQQKKHIQHFMVKNENQVAPIHNVGLQPQQHLHLNHSHPLGITQTQDMEAFKKLLDQITPTPLNAVKLPPQNCIQQLPPPPQPQQPQMHRLPPPVNMMTTIGALPQPAPPHMMKNDELTKFIQQQQLHQRRQQHVLPQHPQLNQPTPNDMPMVQAMFLAPQQRFEAQLLLQGMTRGEVAQNSLGHQLSNPNASPRTKEVLATVMRENSRDTSPNIIMPVPQIMSPVLGQSHCAPNIPPPTPIIIPSTQQIAFNHPPQSNAQQQHSSSGTNTGGLPQRIPSPRELQYHTQSIMQNALIKKKLEEQQENFRRRQEVQKQQQQMQHKPLQSPSHIEINEFGVIIGPPQQQQQQQQQYPPNQQHQKKASQQQQQLMQGQQQQRHINSPTPLAFTPTSVLRKMTAEKDSVSSFHTSAPTPVSTTVGTGAANNSPLISTVVSQNLGPNNANANAKPIHSLLMHYQQQQQTNSSQNQPRMILGVGSQQHQQQGASIIAGPSIQQQHPDNARLNPTLRNNHIKWSGPIMNQISITKPMGRPILKGSLSQSIPPPINSGLNPIHQQQSQPLVPQMTFASKIEFQQIQQQRANNNQTQQPPPHPQKQQQSQQQPMPSQQQAQNIVMTQLYQQRAALQRAQQYQLHQLHQQQQQMNIIQNNGSRPVERISSNTNANQPTSSCGNIINYQRDGGLSPTSNQLARWFSPELLAQASAGKLPPLNMNQALSLEEFEKSIQHSSTAVNN